VIMRELDGKVIEFLDELIYSGKFIADLRKEQKEAGKKNQPLQIQLDRIEKQLEKKQHELNRLMKLYLITEEEDDIAIASYKETETAIRGTIKGLQEEQTELTQKIADNEISEDDIAQWEKDIRAIRLPAFPTSEAERKKAIADLDKAIQTVDNAII